MSYFSTSLSLSVGPMPRTAAVSLRLASFSMSSIVAWAAAKSLRKGRITPPLNGLMAHALDAVPVRLLSYCLMPNHWHLLLCPQSDGKILRGREWVGGRE